MEPVVPDTKDWTWTLREQCPECGLDARRLQPEDVASLTRQVADVFGRRLLAADARTRPAPGVWSTTEYGAHVRDVCVLFDDRLAAMLTQVEPTFADWNQDATAVRAGYAQADPGAVAAELRAAAARIAAAWEAVTEDQEDRRATRSDGSQFTVLTLGQYFSHDLFHHAWDVTDGRPAG